MSEIEDVDYHWGPHPAFGYMTKHVGTRKNCSGPDCGIEEWEMSPEELVVFGCSCGVRCEHSEAREDWDVRP